MSVEEDLRTTLLERAAADATPQPDLLTAVRAGVRRDRRRRTAMAGAAAALALAAVAAVPVLGHADRARPPAPPAASATAGGWAPPAWPPLTFPMRPGWLPPSAGEPVVTQLGRNVLLSYETGTSVLSAEIGPLEPSWESEGEEDHAGTVGARHATVRTAGSYDGSKPGERFVGVRWKLADGRYVQVVSFGPRTEAEVLRFARGLRAGSVPGAKAPFTVDAVPPGLSLQHQSADTMCLATAQAMRQEREPSGLCFAVTGGPYEPESFAQRLTVGGRPAAYDPDVPALHVELDAGRVLEFSWDPEAIPLSRDDIVRFAAGVHSAG